jgi:SEC-C motif-containing protein
MENGAVRPLFLPANYGDLSVGAVSCGSRVSGRFLPEVQTDRVQFIATYRLNGKAYKLPENSRFVLEDGKWFYLS